jgi:hypothetical protein
MYLSKAYTQLRTLWTNTTLERWKNKVNLQTCLCCDAWCVYKEFCALIYNVTKYTARGYKLKKLTKVIARYIEMEQFKRFRSSYSLLLLQLYILYETKSLCHSRWWRSGHKRPWIRWNSSLRNMYCLGIERTRDTIEMDRDFNKLHKW